MMFHIHHLSEPTVYHQTCRKQPVEIRSKLKMIFAGRWLLNKGQFDFLQWKFGIPEYWCLRTSTYLIEVTTYRGLSVAVFHSNLTCFCSWPVDLICCLAHKTFSICYISDTCEFQYFLTRYPQQVVKSTVHHHCFIFSQFVPFCLARSRLY